MNVDQAEKLILEISRGEIDVPDIAKKLSHFITELN